ncbi:MAG: cation-translocating P-type ATPase [Lachnospiraceae bacterium]|jgi:Ca2+-transporting ATPase|nr:cation-translocating P-type ATPase [Lachnospiraceae bacterium]
MYNEKTIAEVINELSCDVEQGLTTVEAVNRADCYGINRLEEKKKKSFFALFMEQLNDPLIYVLLAAVAISLFLHEVGDAIIIVAVILLNAVIGIVQEGKALKAIEALQKLTSPKALVRRDGIKQEIDSAFLVPGDIVCLEAGRQVPADLRLIETINLKAEESALTGESVPVDKDALFYTSHSREGKGAFEKNSTGMTGNIGDQKNMAFMSTTISYGRGEGIVVATGMNTQIGKIAGLINESGNEMTPLQKRLGDLGKVLSIVAVAICLLLFVVAVLQRRDIGDMLLTAISLAVAAVPEGLPAIVTIVLALSVSGMVAVNTIVRRLPSVETLGSVNVVCSDKTGTLTKNRMTVMECYANRQLVKANELDRERHQILLDGCVLCNDAVISGEYRIGDPTELALLDLAALFELHKERCEARQPRVEERAFDSARKRMTTVHKKGKARIAYTKGAADELIGRCQKILIDEKEVAFSQQAKKETQRIVDEMASRALRVLAIAIKNKGELTSEEDMVLVGLVGMIDPARPEAAGAVSSFKKAHVDTVMITGDHIDTAFAIAKELRIADRREQCLSGSQLDQLTPAQFAEQVESIRVYARVSPEHKVRIVEAFKQKGRIVAMTGDGVNDAPSLKAADVGIAMGKEGTDVARNAADLVLTDDNFATIEKAIKEGRGIFENIRKTILFLLSSNFGEIITMMVAVFVGLPAPLKASHILWINLITDSLPALALGMDENDGEALMKQRPRLKKENLFAHGGLTCTLCYGMVIALISLLAFLQVPYAVLTAQGIPVSLSSLGTVLAAADVLAKAQTHAFTVLAMSQLFHAIGMRDTNKSVFRMKHLSNKAMLGALCFGIILQVVVTIVPYFVTLFGTAQLSLPEWGGLAALSLTPLLVHELLILGGIAESDPKRSGDQPTDEDKTHGVEPA